MNLRVQPLGLVDDLERLVDGGQLEEALDGRGATDEHEPAADLARAAAGCDEPGEPARVEEEQLAQVDADAVRLECFDAAAY